LGADGVEFLADNDVGAGIQLRAPRCGEQPAAGPQDPGGLSDGQSGVGQEKEHEGLH
jgi:hypothetical protein